MHFEPFDAKAHGMKLALIFSDPVYEHFFRDQPFPPTEQDFQNYPLASNSVVMSIIEGCLPIGFVIMRDVNARHRTCGAAILIFKEFQKAGYGKQAYKMWCDYLFNTVNIRKITARTVHYAAFKLAISCGFQVEGVFEQECYVSGKYLDETRLSLFKENLCQDL